MLIFNIVGFLWTRFRDDLKLWLQMTASTPSSPSPDFGVDNVQFDDSEQVKETLESVKIQQKQITERLTMEQRRLETELNIGQFLQEYPKHLIFFTWKEAFDYKGSDMRKTFTLKLTEKRHSGINSSHLLVMNWVFVFCFCLIAVLFLPKP